MKRAGGIGSQPGAEYQEGEVHVCTCIHGDRGRRSGGDARFIVFICSWPTETTPRLSSLRDCWAMAESQAGGGLGETVGRLFVVLFECRPKTILYHVEDSSAIVIVVAVIYNLQRGGERERDEERGGRLSQTSVKCSTKLDPCLLFIKCGTQMN